MNTLAGILAEISRMKPSDFFILEVNRKDEELIINLIEDHNKGRRNCMERVSADTMMFYNVTLVWEHLDITLSELPDGSETLSVRRHEF
jgi:hypothetical protein